MGMGSLARYRRHFMILGFLLFAGGGLMRWHFKRQMQAVERRTTPVEGSAQPGWVDDCKSYACRALGASGSRCDDVCEQAVKAGVPAVEPERIARACKSYCVSEEGKDDATCLDPCFLREAKSAISR